MLAAAHHLARRGMEIAESAGKDGPRIDISPFIALIFALTCLTFMVAFFSIRYTYGNVVGCLTIIESPVSEAFVSVEPLPNSAAPKPAESPETDGLLDPDFPAEVAYKPITSSLRATVLHLRTRAGYWSRFRGFWLFFSWVFARSILIALITALPFMRSFVGLTLASIMAEASLAPFELTWYHIIISDPSPKKWWQRLPSFRPRTWLKITPAVALRATATQIAAGLPMLLTGSVGAFRRTGDPNFQPGTKDFYAMLAQSSGVFLLVATLFALLEIPATVACVRVAASMLPDEHETIVPFDRTFGGKVTPAIIGGQGKVGIVEAWRSFTWAGRMRLFKLVVKVFIMLVAVWVLFVITLVVEAHVLIGAQKMGEIMKNIHRAVGRH